jgi:hypothetical protein
VTDHGPLTELLGTAARAGVHGPWLFDYAVLLLAGRAAALVPLLEAAGPDRPSLPDGVCTVAAAVLDALEGFVDLRAPSSSRAALCAMAEGFATAVAEWVFDTERSIVGRGSLSTADALRSSWNALELRILLNMRQCLESHQ